MAKNSNTKTAKKRVKIGKLSTTKTKLTGKGMKKVKGGRHDIAMNVVKAPDDGAWGRI